MDFANFPSRAHFFSFSLFFSLCGQSLTCAKLTRHRFNYQPVFVYVAIRNIVLFVETNNPFTFYLFKGTIFDPIALLIIGQIRRLIGSRPQLRRTSFTHSHARPTSATSIDPRREIGSKGDERDEFIPRIRNGMFAQQRREGIEA